MTIERRPRIYLDYNASAPLLTAAREAMIAALAAPGNASSVHAEGRAARALMEDARVQVAALLGASPRLTTFVSGATEAANLLLTPSLRDAAGPVDELWIAAVEHPCVLAGHRFPLDRVRILPVDSFGRLDLRALDEALEHGGGRVLLALQAANNETGAVQPVAEAARRIHAKGGLLVCDAVQAAGRLAETALAAGADAAFISSHKLGGPKGAGAVAFARPELHIDHRLVRGGGQERGLRGGTENVAALAGFGAAAATAMAEQRSEYERLGALRDGMEARLRAALADVVIFGQGAARLPNTSALAAPGIAAETLLIALDADGFAVSSGSACSSGKVKASHVLAAMGVDDHISRGALRISLGWATSESEISSFCETFQITVRNIGARRSGSAARF